MPLPWTAGRRELEQKKLATSTGWTYPTAKDEKEEVRVLSRLMLVQQHQTAAGHTRFVFGLLVRLLHLSTTATETRNTYNNTRGFAYIRRTVW